jgi:hypothetical protein
MRACWTGAALIALAVVAAPDASVPAFSSASPGVMLPTPWRTQALRRKHPADVRLVADEGRTVLQVRSESAFGGAAIRLQLAAPVLSWRWKVDRVLDLARLGTREGDDFAARVYVSFEIPMDQLTFGERMRLRIARLIYGDVPSAAICYVWDNRASPGTSTWSPYGDRVRLVVLRSGPGSAGRWEEERRDVAADFRAAFGREAPPVTGIAAGNDTDQTAETATAWFGDFRIEPR